MLEECGVTRPEDIDLERIAEANRIEVVYDDIDGATASVLRLGDVARVRISSRIHDVGWQRFTVAHEIGHLRCGHVMAERDAHETLERTCKPLDKTRSVPEREASVFATEVLMPEHMVRPYLEVPHVTLAPARAGAAHVVQLGPVGIHDLRDEVPPALGEASDESHQHGTVLLRANRPAPGPDRDRAGRWLRNSCRKLLPKLLRGNLIPGFGESATTAWTA